MSPYGAPPGAPQAPQTLESFLAQRGPLAMPELIPLLGPVMDQVGTLHSAGQHHGNLSPDTITVTPTPQGTMAAWLPPTTPLAAGAWPFFQSPEQLFAGGQVGYWSDIYAMAGIIHRSLTGQPPFAGAGQGAGGPARLHVGLTHRARIQRQAAAAQGLGARGTPATFVNGRYVRGFRDFAKMKVVIDEELKKARRLLKRGVSRRKLYDHIIARGVRSLVYLD